MDEPTFWVGRWLRQGGGLGGDVNIFPYLRLNTIFFSHSYSPWSRERGEGEGERGHQSLFVHIAIHFWVSISTRPIEWLFIWPSADLIPEQKRTPDLSCGLGWTRPDPVLMLGEKQLLVLTGVAIWRGLAPHPATTIASLVTTCFGSRRWWDATGPLKDSRWSTFLNAQITGLPAHRRDAG